MLDQIPDEVLEQMNPIEWLMQQVQIELVYIDILNKV